jgi:hypothetical protein
MSLFYCASPGSAAKMAHFSSGAVAHTPRKCSREDEVERHVPGELVPRPEIAFSTLVQTAKASAIAAATTEAFFRPSGDWIPLWLVTVG